MLQFVKQTVFQRSEIIKVFKDEIPQALWLLDEKTLFYVTLSGRLLWQESFEFRIMDVSIAADVILILTEKGRIHVRSRSGAKLHDLFLGDSVVVAMASSGGHFAVATEQAQLKFFATNAVASGQFYLEHAVDYLAFCPWDTQSLIASDQHGKVSGVHMQRGLLWSIDFERRLGRPYLRKRPAEIYLPLFADGLQVCNPFGKVVRGFDLRDWVQAVDISADGTRMLLHNQQQQLSLYNGDGAPLWQVDGGETFVSAKLYRDGKQLVAVDRQGNVIIYRENDAPNSASYLEFPDDQEVKS